MQPHEYFDFVSVGPDAAPNIKFFCCANGYSNNNESANILSLSHYFRCDGVLFECIDAYWPAYSAATCTFFVNSEVIIMSPARALLYPFNISRADQMRFFKMRQYSWRPTSIPPGAHIDLSIQWSAPQSLQPHIIKALLVGFAHP